MSHKPTHHRRLRWLALPALIIAGVQFSAAVNVLFRTPPQLAPLMVPPPLLVGGMALFWAGMFGVAALRLWRQSPGVWRFGAWLVLGYLVAHTMQTLLFAASDYARGRLPFVLTISALIAIIPLGYLLQRRKHDGEH